MKEHKLRNRLIRASIQVLFFILYSGAWVAAFAGIRYLSLQIGSVEPIVMNDFLKTLIVLLASTIILGRFFCGFACAFGSFGDLIYGISYGFQKKVLKRRKPFSISKKMTNFLHKGKYMILFAIFLLCVTGQYKRISFLDPWELFSGLLRGDFPIANPGFPLSVALFFVIIVGMALVDRFFCQFLCPMGAVFALMPTIRTMIYRRNRPECLKGCNICEMQCPAKLSIDLDNSKLDECLQCSKCTDLCPKNNIGVGIGKLRGSEIPVVVIKTAILLGAMFIFL